MSDDTGSGHVRRRLGRTGLEVSEISLGCWALGGPNWDEQGQPCGYSGLDTAEAEKAVERGIELGCNHFDTADVYGNGRSEQMLGRLTGGHRHDLVLATKVGWHRGTTEHWFQPLHIRHQLEQSLSNLRTDYVDIYYFHHAEFGESDCWLDDAVEMMRRLRDEGKVRFIGQSAYTVADFERLIPRVDPDVLQARAHMMDIRMIMPESPVARMIGERDLGFVAFSPMAQGLLLDRFRPEDPPRFGAGDNRRESPWFTKDFLEKLAPRLDSLKQRFGGSPEDLVWASLQYVLAHEAVSCVIPGFRNVRQVEGDLAPAGRPMSDEDRQWVRELFADLVMHDGED